MQQVSGELGQHADPAEQADQRLVPADGDQVDVHQRVPGLLRGGIGDDRDAVGDVVGREELVCVHETKLRSPHGRANGDDP